VPRNPFLNGSNRNILGKNIDNLLSLWGKNKDLRQLKRTEENIWAKQQRMDQQKA
jgi:hypothetical protein